MPSETNKKLLKNKKVIEEINRHRWIESEKSGEDIGFEKASTDWLEKFSKAWMQYHMPNRQKSSAAPAKSSPQKKVGPAKRRSRVNSKKV